MGEPTQEESTGGTASPDDMREVLPDDPDTGIVSDGQFGAPEEVEEAPTGDDHEQPPRPRPAEPHHQSQEPHGGTEPA